ncbi:MAG: thioesterase family protein [Caulobacter sp.]|nr:thioesterase family protein [Caulobacter sp.]
MSDSFYTGGAGRYCATDLAVSPWNPRHQNGVAIAALAAHLIETTPTLAPMMLARLTLDIARPTPIGAFDAVCTVTREGRRMQNLEVAFSSGGEITARVSALRVRTAASPVSEDALVYPSPDETPAIPLARRDPKRAGLETRILSGGLTRIGPGSGWVRPALDILPDVAASPLVAAAMAADLGSGLSSIFPHAIWSFANIDLAIHFVRPPESTWIFVDAETTSAGDGAALVNTVLADERGPFARAHQTLFVEPMRIPSASVRDAAMA